MVFWHLNLVIACIAEEIAKCDDVICSNYAAIETLDNRITSLSIDVMVLDQLVSFYQLADNKKPMFQLSCDLEDLRFTRNESCTELWVMVMVRAEDKVWEFVKKAAFTRLWVEFKPARSPFGLQ